MATHTKIINKKNYVGDPETEEQFCDWIRELELDAHMIEHSGLPFTAVVPGGVEDHQWMSIAESGIDVREATSAEIEAWTAAGSSRFGRTGRPFTKIIRSAPPVVGDEPNEIRRFISRLELNGLKPCVVGDPRYPLVAVTPGSVRYVSHIVERDYCGVVFQEATADEIEQAV